MKKSLFLILLSIFFYSCSLSKTVKVQGKSNQELTDYYSANGITNFLIVKNYASMVALNNLDRISIPQNIIFDTNGKEIEHFDDKLCVNHTLIFLQNFNQNTVIKHSNFTISEYLQHFNLVNNKQTTNAIIDTKKIRVFINSATYGSRANKEAFEIYKQFKDKYDIYVVNLDVNSDWKKVE